MVYLSHVDYPWSVKKRNVVLSSALLNSSACGLNSDLSPDSNSDLATDLNVTELPADEFDKCLEILHSTYCDSCESVSYKEVLLEAVAKKDYKRIRKVVGSSQSYVA